jgi:hypothetical protein
MSAGTEVTPRGLPSAPSVRQDVVIAVRLWQDLPRLLGANLIFLLWCAPYALLALLELPLWALAVAPLTVGPGLIALMSTAARVVSGTPPAAWSASLGDARSFRAGALLATVSLIGWHAQLVALRLAVHEAALGAVLLWAAQLAVLLVGALVAVHAVPLVALSKQGLFEATRNGLILAVRHRRATAGALGLIGAAMCLVWALGGAPLVIVPAALAVALVSNTQRLLESQGSIS